MRNHSVLYRTDDYINGAIADLEGTRPETDAADLEGMTDEERAYAGLPVQNEPPQDTDTTGEAPLTTPASELATELPISREEAEAEAIIDLEPIQAPEVTESSAPNTPEMLQAAEFINNALIADTENLNARGSGRQGTLTAREDLADDLLQNMFILVDQLKAQGYKTAALEAELKRPVAPAPITKGYKRGSTKLVAPLKTSQIKRIKTGEVDKVTGLRWFANKNIKYQHTFDEAGESFRENLRSKKGKVTHPDISFFLFRIKTEMQELLKDPPTYGIVIPEQDTVSTKLKAKPKPKPKAKAKAKKAEPTVSKQEAEAEAMPDEPTTGDTTVSAEIKAKAKQAAEEAVAAAEKKKKAKQAKVTVKKSRKVPVTEGPTFEEKAQATSVSFTVNVEGKGEKTVTMQGDVALGRANKRIAALKALRECVS